MSALWTLAIMCGLVTLALIGVGLLVAFFPNSTVGRFVLDASRHG